MSSKPAVLRHRWVAPSPVRMIGKNGPVSLRWIDEILAANAKADGGSRRDNRDRRRKPR